MIQSNNQSTSLIIAPVTLGMLKLVQTENESFIIHNKPTEFIEFMARVKQKTQHPVKTELTVQDFSSSAIVNFYKKKDSSGIPVLENIDPKTNPYIHVIAKILKVQGEVSITGQAVFPVSSFSAISHFYSTLVLCKIKSNLRYESVSNEIINCLRTLNPNNEKKGTAISEIQKQLGFKYSHSKIEEQCSKLASENVLEIGMNWNHYRLGK